MVEKLTAWAGIKPTTLDLESQSGVCNLSAMCSKIKVLRIVFDPSLKWDKHIAALIPNM